VPQNQKISTSSNYLKLSCFSDSFSIGTYTFSCESHFAFNVRLHIGVYSSYRVTS